MAGYNGGLSDAQIREMQKYYGTTVDGAWGPKSAAAAGNGTPLSAQQAWNQYQQQKNSGGGSYSGSTNYGGSSYNNGGLTTDQIVEMQNYYGTAADGLWGQNSTASAGGLNAQQAWQQYQQQKQQEAQQQMQETLMPEVMGFEAFYDRMGGADFEKKLRESINASVQQAVNAYEAQKQETEQDAQEMARQAYVAKLLGEKNMAQRLAAGGYAGGMAESAMLESETNYQNNLAEIQRQRQRALDEIQRAIDNARLTGDMEMANQLADYMAQVQSYYSDYYDQMLSQQMQMQRAQAEAVASAATPSVTQSYTHSVTPAVTPTPAQPMTSSAALNAAVRDAGGSAAQTIRNLQTMYNNGQINAAQLRDLSYAVANPGK